ncbi:hypothetical protein NDU88_004783 [Pleurodeles waltl]|uniref:Uncharacterized protein n=1 Tax=Pleurodeles waltl TaxID=8319 RepID=A0AAV7W5Y8_PLEWA|nr:hypothetical protein NDU88_004783 [Pleurodeles waltl]
MRASQSTQAEERKQTTSYLETALLAGEEPRRQATHPSHALGDQACVPDRVGDPTAEHLVALRVPSFAIEAVEEARPRGAAWQLVIRVSSSWAQPSEFPRHPLGALVAKAVYRPRAIGRTPRLTQVPRFTGQSSVSQRLTCPQYRSTQQAVRVHLVPQGLSDLSGVPARDW